MINVLEILISYGSILAVIMDCGKKTVINVLPAIMVGV